MSITTDRWLLSAEGRAAMETTYTAFHVAAVVHDTNAMDAAGAAYITAYDAWLAEHREDAET